MTRKARPAPGSGPRAADWRDRGSCRDRDPALFFPDKREGSANTRQARRICAGCPVVAECLDHALSKPEPYGVWGGRSTAERERMRLAARTQTTHSLAA